MVGDRWSISHDRPDVRIFCHLPPSVAPTLMCGYSTTLVSCHFLMLVIFLLLQWEIASFSDFVVGYSLSYKNTF
jgi:hypothetical protein